MQTKNIPIETLLNSEAEKDKLRSDLAAMEQQLLTIRNRSELTSSENTQLQKVSPVVLCRTKAGCHSFSAAA